MQMVVVHFSALLNAKKKNGGYLFLGSLHVVSLIMQASICSNNESVQIRYLKLRWQSTSTSCLRWRFLKFIWKLFQRMEKTVIWRVLKTEYGSQTVT